MLKALNPLYCIRLVAEHNYLLRQMLRRNIAARYKGSALGFLWSFAHPLMMLCVYTFVFGIVFKARWGVEAFEDNRAAFPLIMFCGMAVFNIFAESVNTSVGVVVDNPGLVKKVIFPLELLPLCNVATACVFGLAWFALLLVGGAVFLGHISVTLLLLPVTLIPLLLLSAGVSFFVASLGVYLRDMRQLVGLVTQILFFMTPIFYPISIVPEHLRWILEINPLSPVVEQTRRLFLYDQLPEPGVCAVMFLVSGVVFQLGLSWFVKTKKGFADVL